MRVPRAKPVVTPALSGPSNTPVVVKTPADLVNAFAGMMHASVSPAPKANPHDFVIHYRSVGLRMVDGGKRVDSTAEILCGMTVLRTAKVSAIIAPLDHPAICEVCRDLRAKQGAGARLEPVMVRS